MATVYLSPSGNDANTYLQAQNPATPWATVGKCNTSAVSGDTISCAAGTYTFATVSFTKSFTITGPTPVNGLPTAIHDGGNADVTWTIGGGLTLILQNLMIQNVQSTTGVIFEQFSASLVTLTATNCVFKNLQTTVANAAVITMRLGSGGAALTFTGCLFFNCYCQVGGLASSQFDIQGQTVSFNMNGCTMIWTTLPAVAQLMAWTVEATVTGIVKNCIWLCSPAAANFAATKIVTNTTYCDYFGFSGGALTGTGIITSDPLLVDAANANFNLRPTSPCLGTGIIV